MRIRKRFAGLVLAFAMLAAVTTGVTVQVDTEPADAALASWGEGFITGSVYGKRNLKIRDLKTDGHAIRIWYSYEGENFWRDAGISHGGIEWGHFQIGCSCKAIDGVRMKRGYSSWYRTLEW